MFLVLCEASAVCRVPATPSESALKKSSISTSSEVQMHGYLALSWFFRTCAHSPDEVVRSIVEARMHRQSGLCYAATSGMTCKLALILSDTKWYSQNSAKRELDMPWGNGAETNVLQI